ncbi:MAG TPA: 2-alkenal reductase, partial [Planctomycetaceae bacterium]|nr:2-alkenal reductase [Planctomycetaceae bacterium]
MDSPSRQSSAIQRWLILILIVLIVLMTGELIRRQFRQTSYQFPMATNLTQSEIRTIDLFREASPSVVHIRTAEIAFELGRFSLNQSKTPQGSGSGFIWNRRGHIVTNYHVIQNADEMTVTLADNSTWNAYRVRVAPSKDLAVLKIDAPENLLKPIEIGASSNLQVGQTVLAIGNPFGLDQT